MKRPSKTKAAKEPQASAPFNKPVSPPDPAPPAQVPWNLFWALLFVILLFFAAQIVAGLIVSIYPHLQGWGTTQSQDWLTNSVAGQFVFVLIAETLTIAGVVTFLKVCKARLSVIGLKRPRARDVGFGLLLYPLYFISFAIIAVVASHFISGLNVDQQQQIGFNSVHGAVQLTLTFISLVVLPPLTEEILIRGFLFTSLRKYLRFGGAALITSLIFASAHLPEGGAAGPLYIAAIDTFILSVYLCWLREKTGSLWAGITLHALKNLVAFASLFIFAAR